MTKTSVGHFCDQCERYITKGIEIDGLVFCNEKCLEAYQAAELEASFYRRADSFLVEDLGASRVDPDYDRWLERCTGLYKRLGALKEILDQPLGTDWPDEGYSNIVDEVLDMLERKIKAAEEVLGLTSEKEEP